MILSIGTLYVGGWLTCWVMCALSLVGCFELLRVYKLEKRAMGICCYLGTILYYLMIFLQEERFLMPIMVVYLLVILAIYVLNFSKYRDKDMMAAFLAFYYVSVCLSYVSRLRDIKDGGFLVILVFICSWGNDTLAYCAGRLFGKHKMSPVLSPKKSVEGLIGGIVSEIGDLFASSIKRVLNVKDYSRLIPGHGGVLDRFDSTLMAAPVVLILLDLFLMI